MATAIGLLAFDTSQAGTPSPFSIASLKNLRIIDNTLILGLIVVGVLSRTGVVPLQGALLAASERGSLLNTMLYMNSHLGVYLLARLAMPMMPVASQEALVPLADLALFSAACTALIALAEKDPRRLLTRLSISQMSFLLAGLESNSSVGINGALAYWVVLCVSTCGLFLVLRSLEVRLDLSLSLDQFLGLGSHAPRLAVFFLICAVGLVGLPGTLGFVAEDLLIHGTLESHPELGLILPIATALNAISLLRMFAHIFFGRRRTTVPMFADALSRERWALASAMAALVVLGLKPELVLSATRLATAALAP